MFREIEYQENPVNILNAIAKLPYPVLLDSKSNKDTMDVVGASPKLTIHGINKDKYLVKSTDKSYYVNSLNEIIQKYQSIYKNTCSFLQKIFPGGFIGYFSYDFLVEDKLEHDFILDDIGLPGSYIGLYTECFVTCHKLKKTFHICLDNKFTLNKFITSFKSLPIKKLDLLYKDEMGQESYNQSFAYVQQCINAGELYQTNLSTRFKSNTKLSSIDIYNAQRLNNPGKYGAYFKLLEHDILSHSPEQFVKINGNIITTKPIKGTATREFEHELDLDKNIAENLMIVDLMRNDISKDCIPKSVSVDYFAKKIYLPHLVHLESKISAKIRTNTNKIELLTNLAPGGSITGAPKNKSINISEFVEHFKRSIFCGNIFYYDFNDKVDSSIVIRTSIKSGNKLFTYGGGGITIASNAKSEYQEIYNKLAKIINL